MEAKVPLYDARFYVFTEMKFQVQVFWVLTSCSVGAGYQSFGRRVKVKLKAVRSSEMLVCYSNTTRCCKPEDLDLVQLHDLLPKEEEDDESSHRVGGWVAPRVSLGVVSKKEVPGLVAILQPVVIPSPIYGFPANIWRGVGLRVEIPTDCFPDRMYFESKDLVIKGQIFM
jgi:hypothetical protein